MPEVTRPLLPRSSRSRRSGGKNENVFQLDGVRSEKTRFESSGRKFVVVQDWRMAAWLDEDQAWRKNYGVTENGIRVKEAGVYYLYANLLFTGIGKECYYKLQYGPQGTDSRLCIWKSNDGGEGESTISQRRPCYLGFAVYLEAQAEVKISLLNHQRCRTNNKFFQDAQPQSVLGIIKQ